jgi:purine-nucleoside phosphorylase
MRNLAAQGAAAEAARAIQKEFGRRDYTTGLILGTGWGGKLRLDGQQRLSFSRIPGFSQIQALEGHEREVVVGKLGQQNVIMLSGRVHINEASADPTIHRMVRLQTEMLMQLSVPTLIVTCAAGSLPHRKFGFLWRDDIKVGSLVVIDGFVTVFAPDMPLWAGEFCSPEDVLSPRLRKIAVHYADSYVGGKITTAGYAMVRGPYFEGRRYDKALIAKSNAGIVGMSTLPEACIASLYPGTEVLALAFVTNDCLEVHSHRENLARANLASQHLGNYLLRIVKSI